MKNRILSIILMVALLLSLLPVGSAFATEETTQTTEATEATEVTETTGATEATESTEAAEVVPDKYIDPDTVRPSQQMIDMIKSMEGFAEKPYWDYAQYSVGYGTKPKTDEDLQRYMREGISREEAEELLYYHAETKGVSLKRMIKNYDLKLTQAQYDALLSFSYNCGASWTNRDTTVRKAVVEGWTDNDFIFAIGEWCTAAGNINTGLVRRRMREANMYLNGVYSMTVPETYTYVLYDAGAGMCTSRIQVYDSALPAEFKAVATWSGLTFDGWYTAPYGGEKVEKLNAQIGGEWLYAHWRAGDGADVPQGNANSIQGTAVDYNREMQTDYIPVFEKPVKGALVVDTLRRSRVVHIVAEYKDENGVLWGQVESSGWINLKATELTDKEPGKTVEVTVSADGVNVRSGPGTNYSILGSINSGKKLTITEVASGTGYLWGRMESGWICLTYTNYEEVSGGTQQPEQPEQPETPDEPETPEAPDSFPRMATITGNRLRVRKGPSTGYGVVSYLNTGDRVKILEVQIIGSMSWGKIATGWISMDYAKLDPVEEPEESTPTEPAPTEPAPTEPAPTEPAPTEPTPTEPTPSEPEQPTEQQGTVTATGRLRVRKGPGTSYGIAAYLYQGDRVRITETKEVDGTSWGKVDNGWISMEFVKLDGTEESPSEPEQPETPSQPETPATPAVQTGTVTVTSGRLRIRSGAGTSYAIVGYLHGGDKVTISEQKTVDGTAWAHIEQGWVSMDYIQLSTNAPAQTVTKTVTAGVLNIRAQAGTNNPVVGYLYKGNSVEVLETKAIGATTWCRISRGWVSGDYLAS